jgi:hypothetical protein
MEPPPRYDASITYGQICPLAGCWIDFDDNGVGGASENGYVLDSELQQGVGGVGGVGGVSYLVGGVPIHRQWPRVEEGTLLAVMMEKEGSVTADLMEKEGSPAVVMMRAVGPLKADASNTVMLGGALCVMGIALVALVGVHHRRRLRGYSALPGA